jgi:hypothetical protein
LQTEYNGKNEKNEPKLQQRQREQKQKQHIPTNPNNNETVYLKHDFQLPAKVNSAAVRAKEIESPITA